MSESFDIHDLLQTGYFTTSRAKSAQTDSQPTKRPPVPPITSFHHDVAGTLERMPPSPKSPAKRPPPPTVEDEAASLAREHGPRTVPGPAHEEAQSRGDVDQHPLIMEVHEHNPERRFVVLTDAEKEAVEAAETAADKSDTASNNGDSGREQRRRRDSTVVREKRRSRQDLPPIDTDQRHSRNGSVNTNDGRDYFANRKSRHYDSHLLSPEIITQGGRRREKVYHGATRASNGRRSPVHRTQSASVDDRKYDEEYSKSARYIESNKTRRRLSNERSHEGRRNGYLPRGPTTREPNPREQARSRRRSDADRMKPPPTYRSRDNSHSSDEHSQSSRATPGRRGRQSVVIQDDRAPLLVPEPRNGGREARSRSRVQPSAASKGVPDKKTDPRMSTASLPYSEGERKTRDRPASLLPYPDDGDVRTQRSPVEATSERRAKAPQRAPPMASMPDIPMASSFGSESGSGTAALSPALSQAGTNQSWPPPSFDPDRHSPPREQAMGSYRRFSEQRDENGPAELPQCPRVQPVVGAQDWLTLPRTDFNICPHCYSSVFARSEYATQFQPILRSTEKPISCDFGCSPWYRIAWLLTLKNQSADLRLFHQIANVAMASRNQPCPGGRRTQQTWYTVKDPTARRPVKDFTVCYQCAKTVEALLPNLTGIFVPSEPRSEPTKGICALHFAPDRKRFILYFDVLETNSERALSASSAPNLTELAAGLEKLSFDVCQEDKPVEHGYWHNMQFLPEFTVCARCFEEAVRPKLGDESVVPRNFYTKRQKLPRATCQLYSARMRDVFNKACARNDPKYLEDKVRERMRVEKEIQAELAALDGAGRDEEWVNSRVEKLVREWGKWE